MNFKKIMSQNGSKMIKSAAQQTVTPKNVLDEDNKVISEELAKKMCDAIKENGRITNEIALNKIVLDENVRKNISQESLKELADSMKDVGLIHNILLHLVKRDGKYYLNCTSGQRRIMAAEILKWDRIDADIMIEKSEIESMYVGVIANLHESVFWLDNALLYQDLHDKGQSDEEIAERVKVNSRTISWFRRLSKMSKECQKIANSKPELFNSRWAQNLARHGELPTANILEEQMEMMVKENRTWHMMREDKVQLNQENFSKLEIVQSAIKSMDPSYKEEVQKFFKIIQESGLITKANYKIIEQEFLNHSIEITNNQSNQELSNITQ